MFQIGDLPPSVQMIALPIVFAMALLTLLSLHRTNQKLRLEQQNLMLDMEAKQQKLAEARRTGDAAELGDVVEGLALPILRNQEATFLLIRFLFVSMVLVLTYATTGFIISLAFGVSDWAAQGLDHRVEEISRLTASIAQVVGELITLLVAFGFGWPLYRDVRNFLQRAH